MAIYRVKNKKTGDKTAVITRTKAGAIKEVAKDDYDIEVITGAELLKEYQAGTKCIDLSDKDDEEKPELPVKDVEKEKHEKARAQAEAKNPVAANASKPSAHTAHPKAAASK